MGTTFIKFVMLELLKLLELELTSEMNIFVDIYHLRVSYDHISYQNLLSYNSTERCQNMVKIRQTQNDSHFHPFLELLDILI